MRKVLLAAVALVGLSGYGLWSIGLMAPTDVAFQSSNGEWADSEMLWKGRKFEEVVTLFELYRGTCQPEVQLQRITQRPRWYTIGYLLNDYSDPKWQVPYASPLPQSTSRHYCVEGPKGPDEIREAKERARRYIEDLAQQALASDARNARA